MELDAVDEFVARLRDASLAELLTDQLRDEEALHRLVRRRERDGLSDAEYDEMERRFCDLGAQVSLRQARIDGIGFNSEVDPDGAAPPCPAP